jgi:hypothetical protein
LLAMKIKKQLYNCTFLLVIVFSILFQSLHSYEHIIKQFSEKQCHHKYSNSKAEITHNHPKFENCFVCKYSFSGYCTISLEQLVFNRNFDNVELFSIIFKTVSFFSGSLFSLRAPPSFIA